LRERDAQPIIIQGQGEWLGGGGYGTDGRSPEEGASGCRRGRSRRWPGSGGQRPWRRLSPRPGPPAAPGTSSPAPPAARLPDQVIVRAWVDFAASDPIIARKVVWRGSLQARAFLVTAKGRKEEWPSICSLGAKEIRKAYPVKKADRSGVSQAMQQKPTAKRRCAEHPSGSGSSGLKNGLRSPESDSELESRSYRDYRPT
jgi:hypothetical protein